MGLRGYLGDRLLTRGFEWEAVPGSMTADMEGFPTHRKILKEALFQYHVCGAPELQYTDVIDPVEVYFGQLEREYHDDRTPASRKAQIEANYSTAYAICGQEIQKVLQKDSEHCGSNQGSSFYLFEDR